MNEKPKLPSIKDLLEGGPGLIGKFSTLIKKETHKVMI